MIQALKCLQLPNSQNSLWTNNYFPSNKCGSKMLWRLRVLNMWSFTLTIRKFKSSFLSFCLVRWIWHSQNDAGFAKQRGLALHAPHYTALSAHSLNKTVSLQALLQQWFQIVGPLKTCEVPPDPSETIRKGKWAAYCKTPPEKVKLLRVNLEYQRHFLKWLQTWWGTCSFEVEYIKFF